MEFKKEWVKLSNSLKFDILDDYEVETLDRSSSQEKHKLVAALRERKDTWISIDQPTAEYLVTAFDNALDLIASNDEPVAPYNRTQRVCQRVVSDMKKLWPDLKAAYPVSHVKI